MARNPQKARKGKLAKKRKIEDLPAGRKAKGVKGGIIVVDGGTPDPTLSSQTLSSFSLNFKKV